MDAKHLQMLNPVSEVPILPLRLITQHSGDFDPDVSWFNNH